MITDTARAHGAFFVMLFDQFERGVKAQRLPQYGAGFYLIDDVIPIYLKVSNKRIGPWTFTFNKLHQNSQIRLYEQFGECLTGLICGKDGIAGLYMSELRQVLNDEFQEQEQVSVRRQLKTMYNVKGRHGPLEKRVSRKAIFEKLLSALSQG